VIEVFAGIHLKEYMPIVKIDDYAANLRMFITCILLRNLGKPYFLTSSILLTKLDWQFVCTHLITFACV